MRDRTFGKWNVGAWPIRHAIYAAGLTMPFAAAGCAHSPELVHIGPEKKLIEWGWDEPNPAFMRENAKQMDTYGFDGVIFHTEPYYQGRAYTFDWQAWGAIPFEYEGFAQIIEDLKAAHAQLRQMTHNFLRLNVCPGDVDWFDDEAFGVVIHNARLGARVAKEGGCKGIMFDVEQYKARVWAYEAQVHKDTKSFAEYEAVAQKRGRQFMLAMQDAYPDIILMMTYGYNITGARGDPDADRSMFSYGLLKGFLDGMYDAATGRTTIVDGFEEAYSFRTHREFVNARKHVFEKLLPAAANPRKYLKHGRMAFGVWMDNTSGVQPWDPDDIEKNYFLPDEIEYSVFSGLDVADNYVWLYTEQPRWWTNERLPQGYLDAIKRVRAPRPIDDAGHLGRPVKDAPGSGAAAAASQAGYSDAETFGDLASEFDFVANLPKKWKFRTGAADQGSEEGWYEVNVDPVGWRDMQIGRFWDEQGVRYHGTDAWYRLTWDTPPVKVPAGSKLFFFFGAVDDRATVWVNGREAGGHYEHPDMAWEKRFSIDVTGMLIPGQENTIAVRVGNELFAGGIWKSVKLAVSKQ